MIPRAQPILLVEDSPEDRTTTIRALAKAGLANPIIECEDGDSALDYLRHRGRYANRDSAPRPGIILLDLNMPGTDGREVLAEIKSDDDLRDIPVVVLTTSNDEVDIDRCYKAGANSYVLKPVNLNRFMEAVQRLTDYWFEVALLPKSTPGPR